MMQHYLYIIELVHGSIHGRKPEEKPEGILWEKLFLIASEHMIVGLTYESIAKLEKKPEDALLCRWREQADKALVKELTFDAERQQIEAAFEREGIKYIPLKGIVLKNFYPKAGLRQFSDNDILYDAARQDDAEQIMRSLGYSGEKEEGNHDVYLKPPVFNFELHTKLLPHDNENRDYFENIWDRAVQREGMAYEMTDLDFYLFHIVHLHKHFSGSGTGLRYFVDQYYLKKNLAGRCSADVLDRELEKLGLLAFEREISHMAELLFAGERAPASLKGKEEELFLYVMSCGAYGNFEYLIKHRMEKKNGKWAYFVSRLTCDDVFLRHDYPVLKKAPYLKPVFVVWRLVSAPFKKPDKVKAEFRALFRRKK